MANIIEAAKWMLEGKRVRREDIPYWVLHFENGRISPINPEDYSSDFNCADVLANDWEVAE